MQQTRTLASLTQSTRAFQESRVLLTALELDIFTVLGDGAAAPDCFAANDGSARHQDAAQWAQAFVAPFSLQRCASEKDW